MTVYIGLGSNLADPIKQVKKAIDDLVNIAQTKLVAVSSLYSSPPMGPQDQPDYINAVAALQTELSPEQLLDELQKIEQQHGRVRHRHWGERTLDLDILLFGDQAIDDERLQIPHLGITRRAFVLYPLAEIAPEIVIPGHDLIANLLPLCPKDGLQRITDSTHE